MNITTKQGQEMEVQQTTGQCQGIKLFVEQGDQEVGRAFLYIMHNDLHEEPFGLLEDVYIDESLRGQGIGTELVHQIIEVAQDHNCYKLIATSRHSRSRVHELYKRLGFEDWGVEFRMNF